MKKLVFLLVCLFTLQTVARADDDKPIQVTQMPQPAQQFIKQHFDDSKVALAKMEFDNLGIWEDVYCKYSSVPSAIIPAAFQIYVTTNYPDAKILKIERDKKDYEVKLSNRTELKFDLKFNLIDIDF